MAIPEDAASILRSGGLIAFPTETVYGLGADATNPQAIAKIFAAKGRPGTNPLIVHAADAQVARRYATRWPDAAATLAAAFWPGPITLVLSKSSDIVDAVTAGRGTVGLRVPDHPLALELLRAFGGPVAAPSANRSNHISPTTAQHVRDELGDAVDLILDGGPCRVGIESTVLDLSGDTPAILRPGGVSRQRIEAMIGPVRASRHVASQTEAALSPGQLPVHYAPRTAAWRFETSQRGRIPSEIGGAQCGIVVLSPMDLIQKDGPIVTLSCQPEVYARHLYQVLRELDAMDLAAIFIELPPDQPEWAAVRDRIIRATQPY
jgi:L-threonylcarbamoyladenylate synthase